MALPQFICSTCGRAAGAHDPKQHRPTRYCRDHDVTFTPPGVCPSCWTGERQQDSGAEVKP